MAGFVQSDFLQILYRRQPDETLQLPKQGGFAHGKCRCQKGDVQHLIGHVFLDESFKGFQPNPVCFMALAVSKHIEISAEISIRAFLTHCKKITDARLRNKITKKEINMRIDVPENIKAMIAKILRPH